MEFVPAWKDYWILLQFIAVFGVSGWLTYRVAVGQPGGLAGHGETSAGRGDAFRNLINPVLLSIVGGLVPTSFFLLFCAQLGVSRIRFLLLLLAVYSLVCLAYLLKSGKLKLQWISPKLSWLHFGWSDLWLLAILALGLFTFGKPSEYVTSQRDPGEYVNIAVRLAQEQALQFTDPDYQDFNMDRQKLFLPVPLDRALHLEVVPGFSLVDAQSGEMLPQYLHLFPLWLALAFKLWRFDGLFSLNVILGLLSLVLVVSLAVEVFRSKTVGLVASTLLCLNLGQIWLVRSPFSEVLAQVLLLAGIWILTLAVARRQGSLGFLSGLVFGLTLMVRIDSVLAVLAVVFFLILGKSGIARFGTAWVWPCLMGLGLSLAYTVVHVTLFAYPYVLNILLSLGLLPLLPVHWVWLAALALSAITAIWGAGWLLRSMKGWMKQSSTASRIVGNLGWSSPAWRTSLFWGISGLVTIAFAYGYFIRPLMASGGDLLALPPPHQGTVRFYDELNLVRLGWYLSPVGLFLAYVGSILALRPVFLKRQIGPALFLLVLGVFLLFYGYKSRAFPDNYWVIRRYAEIVIPGLLILAALTLQRLYRMATVPLVAAMTRPGAGRFLLRACSLGLLIVLITWQTVVAWPFLREGEHTATLKQMGSLASRMVDADVVLFEYGVAQQFFLGPLRNVFGQSVFPLAHSKPDPAAFERVVGEFMAEGKRVFVVACEEQTSLLSSKYVFEPKERFYFSSQVVEQTYERLPKGMAGVHYRLQIYEVQPRPQGSSKPFSALNADSGFGYATTGFYGAESEAGGNTYRWSRGDASVELPEIDASQPAVLIARLARPSVGAATRTPIRVLLNGHDLGPIQLSRRFKDYNLPIAQSQLARGKSNLVEFLSDSFNPAASQAGADKRNLGFMLDCVRLKALMPVTGSNLYQVGFNFDTECSGIQVNDFYPPEGTGLSWTGLSPSLTFPMLIDTRQTYQVVLRAVKSNPDPEYRQFLTVWVNEVELETKEMIGTGDQFREYSFAIPPEALNSQPVMIRFQVRPTWNPSLAGESSDIRNLGCALQWIRIESREVTGKAQSH